MVRSDSPEEGEIIDLTATDDDQTVAKPSTRNVHRASRPAALASRVTLNRRRGPPIRNPGQQPRRRRRSRSRSWSRSRSRSPIAAKDTQNGEKAHVNALAHVPVSEKEQENGKQQQVEGSIREPATQESDHILSPTEERIEKAAQEEAELQHKNVEKAMHQSPSGHNLVVDHLLSAGKLCLVLDLDHTLLHSVMFSELDPKMETWLQSRAEVEAALPQQERRNLAYASAVIPFLDPTGSIFGGRIIAQGAERVEDMLIDQPKALKHGLEAREAVTIVVDDSFAVWQAHVGSLIMVERYIYFPSNRNVVKGTSLLENHKDEDMKAGMLMITLDLLEKIHAEVFKTLKSTSSSSAKISKNKFVDVQRILTENRKKVLKGVHLVFSRVIPLEQDPKTHELWKMAEAFGACCSAVMQPGVTTHLVAGDGGTEKVSTARANGVAVVSPMWLRGCCLLWKRLDEKQYAVIR